MNTLHSLRTFAVRLSGLAVIGLIGLPAANAQLLLNGGFEAGLSNWTVNDQVGGSGSWYSQTGTTSPLTGFTVAAPVEGSFAAMSDQSGPGSHVLFQDFIVPVGVSFADLSFSYTINNTSTAFINGPGLDALAGVPNQQARVDIITTSAGAFSVAGGDVLLNIFQTNPGDPLSSPYTFLSTDVTALFQAHAGETLRLRFAETDNQLFFNFGIDNVQLNARIGAVPEPSTYGLIGAAGLLGLVAWKRSRRTTQVV